MKVDKEKYLIYIFFFLITSVWYFAAALYPSCSIDILYGGLALGIAAGLVTIESKGLLGKWFWLVLVLVVVISQLCAWKNTSPRFLLVMSHQLVAFIPFGLVLLIDAIPAKTIIKQAVYSSFLALAFAVLSPVLYSVKWENSIQMSVLLLWTCLVFVIYSKGKTKQESTILLCSTPLLVSILLVFNPTNRFFIIWMYVVLVLVFIAKYRIANKRKRVSTICCVAAFSFLLTMLLDQNVNNYLYAKNVDCEQGCLVEEPFALNFSMITKEGETLTQKRLKGKNTAIFFWSNKCGQCHGEMPFFSDLAAEYKNDSSKLFIAAYISFDENDILYYESEIQQDYEFIWARACYSQQIMEDLQFNEFPHLAILNKEGKVVYNGIVSNRPWIFAYNPRKYLNY